MSDSSQAQIPMLHELKKDDRESDDDGVLVETLAMKQKEAIEKVSAEIRLEPEPEAPKELEALEKELEAPEKDPEELEAPEMELEAPETELEASEKEPEAPKKEPKAPKKEPKISQKMAPKQGRSTQFRQLMLVLGSLVCLSAVYFLSRCHSVASTTSSSHVSLILPVLSLPSAVSESEKCFADSVQNIPKVELRVLPCASSQGRVIPRLNRSDYFDVESLLLESGYNLLEGLPENGLTTLALDILSHVSAPFVYINFRQFTDFGMLITESFGLKKAHLYDVFKAVEKILQERANGGTPPMLMVFDHFEVALRNTQFQAERFYTWVFDMEHKSLVRAKFLSSDVKLAAAMRELVKWKLSPIAFPAVSKSDVHAYLANVTMLDPKAIERVATSNLGMISRIAAQYLRGNDVKTTNISLDECLKRMTPRSDFLAHLGNFAWNQ